MRKKCFSVRNCFAAETLLKTTRTGRYFSSEYLTLAKFRRKRNARSWIFRLVKNFVFTPDTLLTWDYFRLANPLRTAYSAACVRLASPSLPSSALTYLATVFS